jgi:hypothetical protein
VTLEVEDGTGLEDAQSYLSVEDADAYHAARGTDAWTDEDEVVKEQALVRATFALDAWLRGRWLGVKKTATQALAWPRLSAKGATTGVTDEEGFELSPDAVPGAVIAACAEIALIELSQRFLQQTVNASNAIAAESVGPISVSYRDSAPSITYYPHIEALLRGVAAVGGISINMVISLTPDELTALNSPNPDVFDFPQYFNLIKGY